VVAEHCTANKTEQRWRSWRRTGEETIESW
jgi:hypothetical protein